MSSVAIEDPTPRWSGRPAPKGDDRERKANIGGVDAWLESHLNTLAAAIFLAGFAVRLYASTRVFLNPDEALHYSIINQTSAWLVYKASLGNAHPPLFYLILYAWHYLGQSEAMLRFPCVLEGTAFCWFGFLWLRDLLGKAAGLIGLTLLALSPSMITLSSEERQYAVMLMFIGAALYFLERAFREQSAGKMWGFTICLYLAILSHYSALFFTVAVGLYVLARFSDARSSKKLLPPWVIGQLGAAALYGVLYITHISKIKSSIAVWSMGFYGAYLGLSGRDIFTFTFLNSLKIFRFLFLQIYVAAAMLALFAVAVGILLAMDLRHRAEPPEASHLGILLLMPFVAIWGASIAGVYPYEGSRHTSVLALFAFAGVSYLLAAIFRKRLWLCLVVTASLVVCAHLSKTPADYGLSTGDNTPAAMARAVGYMTRSIPAGDRILVDYQSFLPIIYYFCGPKAVMPADAFDGNYFTMTCNQDPMISVHYWKFIAPAFSALFQRTAKDNGMRPGDRVWVYQTGWDAALAEELPAEAPQFRCLRPRRFGAAAAVIPLVVGADFSPQVPAGSCSDLTN